MARLKRKSAVLETARLRRTGLNSITKPIDFGANTTKEAFLAKVAAFEARLNAYNQKVSELDDEQNGIDEDERELSQWNKRILSAGEASFGSDSSEYELLGGTRTSERKRPARKSGSGTSGNPTT
jgi:hypothetical protein